MNIAQRVNNALEAALRASRRFDRYWRDAFDDVARDTLVAMTQFVINLLRRKDRLGIAEEGLIPGEERIAQEITAEMSLFIRRTYEGRVALRAGNTKTHGLLRAWFEIEPDLPPQFAHGLFARSGKHPAWVRLAGPSPRAPADLDDNGILSMSIK